MCSNPGFYEPGFHKETQKRLDVLNVHHKTVVLCWSSKQNNSPIPLEAYWKWSFPPFALANISVLFRDIAAIAHRVGGHQSRKRYWDPALLYDLEEITFFSFTCLQSS